MRLIADIDVLGDEALLARMARLSVGILAGGAVACVAVGICLGWGGAASLGWWAALVLASAAALPVHELVHGAAFKLLCPGCRVSFGFESMFLYTNAHKAVLPRGRMTCVLLAPAVVVTLVLAVGAAAAGEAVLACALAALHLAGCVGDVLMAREIRREPECTHVRDTDRGVELLADE